MIEPPESAWPICCICGESVRGSSRALLHEVVGFERERDAGGTNHLIARRRTGRIVGPCCARRVQRGDVAQQTFLVMDE